jgi:hypothetical protein
VSQKPINLGENICVGDDVGVSGHNVYRQMQVGAMAAKTKYVCTAEADNLYPPEFFHFRPPQEDTCYVARPLYVLFAQRGKARVYCEKPRGSESAMIVNRDLLINSIDMMLKGRPKWSEVGGTGKEFPYLFHVAGKYEAFYLSTSVVTIKTDHSLHRKTPHDIATKTRELPYWGKSADLLEAFSVEGRR